MHKEIESKEEEKYSYQGQCVVILQRLTQLLVILLQQPIHPAPSIYLRLSYLFSTTATLIRALIATAQIRSKSSVVSSRVGTSQWLQ